MTVIRTIKPILESVLRSMRSIFPNLVPIWTRCSQSVTCPLMGSGEAGCESLIHNKKKSLYIFLLCYCGKKGKKSFLLLDLRDEETR